MLDAVVVFDPEGALPTSFVADAALPCAVMRVKRADRARRLARHATVVVIVATEDAAVTLGLLASLVQLREARLVVHAHPIRHHQVILHALRRGAIVLIDQEPPVLIACVADLIAATRLPREVARCRRR